MNAKEKIKNFYLDHSPVVRKRRKKLRSQLKNDEITFLCPNCLGGSLFHELGLRFCSPTINLMIKQKEFVQFLFHIDEYLKGEFTFFKDPELTCPCAYLHAESLPDIRVTFTHYNSEEEALKKWITRSARIKKDNMFIFVQERDDITREDIEKLATLKARGILVFTANEYKDIPYAVQIKECEAAGEVGYILKKNYWDGSRVYEKYFDFVKWFNEADGPDYDVTPYVKSLE